MVCKVKYNINTENLILNECVPLNGNLLHVRWKSLWELWQCIHQIILFRILGKWYKDAVWVINLYILTHTSTKRMVVLQTTHIFMKSPNCHLSHSMSHLVYTLNVNLPHLVSIIWHCWSFVCLTIRDITYW